MGQTVRIAMWSGPRNLSTAMMRSFGARPDCAVWDEPYYAAFLAATGLAHPMRDAVLRAHESDPAIIKARLVADPPCGRPLYYQKHMTHHMLPEFDLGFMADMRNAFLIRDPLLVAASYEQKREAPTLADLGFEAQGRLFDLEADRLGHAPPVIDSARIAQAPEAALRALCEALSIEFDPSMLSWPPGRRAEDGVWAAHWYGAVDRSTCFAPPAPPPAQVSDQARRLAEEARPIYERLSRHAL